MWNIEEELKMIKPLQEESMKRLLKEQVEKSNSYYEQLMNQVDDLYNNINNFIPTGKQVFFTDD